MNIKERNKRVEENLALVGYSLKRLGIDYNEDYFQEGVLELIRCAECFDESKGFQFSTYAVTNITFKLKEHIMRDKVLKPKRTGVGGQVYAPPCDSFEKTIANDVDGAELKLIDVISNKAEIVSCSDLEMDLDLLVEKGIISREDIDLLKEYVCGATTRELTKEYKLKAKELAERIKNTKKILKEHLSYNDY